MILSANTLRKIKPVQPFCERTVFNGMSFGLSVAGYDIRIKDVAPLWAGEFRLAVSVERFFMPKNVLGLVKDKSSWARQGLSVFNTVIEPGWEGYLTLELVNLSHDPLLIKAGSPIAQVLFFLTDETTDGYEGKYQNQKQEPQPTIFEQI
jgi:dCTP deaminase